MMDDYTLAGRLYGNGRAEVGKASNNTSTVYAKAVSDSEGGVVEVALEGNVSSADGGSTVAVPTTDRVLEGDDVIITLVGATGKSPYVTGTVGGGDRMHAEIVETGLLVADKASIEDLKATNARVGELEATALTADSATITDLQADAAKVHDLTADGLSAATGYIGALVSENVTAQDIAADHADFGEVKANAMKVANLTAAQLEADHATIGSLDSHYAQIDMANVNNAWIENGLIKDAAITNEMVGSLSANKLTAGTINGSVITVTNLNADNITAGTINGQRIGQGSLSLDKLSEAVYTESEVDGIVEGLNDRIDGAIETHTGTAVPTLNNSPASAWNTADLKDEHVGDVYYVVNSQSQQNGYCYRFTKSGSSYSWQLIKDSDVTAALSRLETAEGKITTFDSDISTLKTDTGELKTKTQTLETSLGDKVDTSTFNELSSTVDENSSTITTMSNVLTTNGLSSSTNITQTVNSVSQTATGNSAKITQLTSTLGTNADGTTKAGDIVHRTSAVEQDLSGFKSTVSETYSTKTETATAKSEAISAAASDATSKANAAKSAAISASATDATSKANAAQSAAISAANSYTDGAVDGLASDADLTALTTRVSTAETNITQNTTAITAKANATDVYTKTQTDGLISTEVTNRNAAIKASADAITSTVSENYAQIQSRGEQLVTNGAATLGSNTNFSAFVYDGSKANGSGGSFTRTPSAAMPILDEFIPVDQSQVYRVSFDALSADGDARLYCCLMCYDIDGNNIDSDKVMFVAGSLTTLAQDLKAGDTKIYLTDVSGFDPNGKDVNGAYSRKVIFWDYKNSFGYLYPEETYSRHLSPHNSWAAHSDIDYTNNTITLRTAWTGATVPAGTKLSQGNSGSTYLYVAAVYALIPAEWHTYYGYAGPDGITMPSGVNVRFRAGTAKVKIGFLWNYQMTAAKPQSQIWVTNVSMHLAVASSTEMGALESRMTTAESSITQQAGQIALKANATDVYTKTQTDGLISTEVTNRNAAITAKANEITSSVSETYAVKSDSVEYITGTQTAVTGAWTGVTKDATLEDGKTIVYKLPYNGSGNATLNLTLSGGGTTGAKGVYHMYSTGSNTSSIQQVNTHYPAGSAMLMSYDAANNRWLVSNYNTNTDTVNRTKYQAVLTAAEVITNTHIICGTSAGYRDIAAGVTFDLAYPLLYAGTAIAKGATSGTRDNNFVQINGISFSANGAITGGAAGKMLYLKGVVSGNSFTIADSPFMTTVPPDSDDGLAYIPLGVMTSATVGYFESSARLHAYFDGGFQPIDSGTMTLAHATATRVTQAETKIDQNSEAIELRATKSEVTAVSDSLSRVDDSLSGLSTRTSALEVKADSFTVTQSKVDDIDGQVKSVMSRMQFSDGALSIDATAGTSATATKAVLTSTKLAFEEANVEVASIGDGKLNIENAEVHGTLAFGGFAFIPRENGNLSLKWIGE